MLDKIVKIPTKPGIYFFKDANNQIIYIGKAKSLRKRVRSYFSSSIKTDPKTRVLVKNISKIELNIELGKNLFVLKQDITKIKKLQLPEFDFIYLDPPYSSNIYSIILKNISDSKILNNKGLILIETDKLINIDEHNLEEIFSKKIGSSYLQCFKKLLNPLK